jgi:hypothetical protein
MLNHRTEAVIADLVDASYGGPGGRRKRHVLRQALYALVRLAKVEQLVEMRLDVEHAAGGMLGVKQHRQTKAMLRKIGMDVHADRTRLELDWDMARARRPRHPCADVENDCGNG